MKKTNINANPPSTLAAGSAACEWCMNWSLPENPHHSAAIRGVGYCEIFGKETKPKHGAQCTAFEPWPDWPGRKPQNKGCGKPIRVIGTNGGTMACGATLRHGKELAVHYCSDCEHRMRQAAVAKLKTSAVLRAQDFNEADCGGVFDGFGVISDADPGL